MSYIQKRLFSIFSLLMCLSLIGCDKIVKVVTNPVYDVESRLGGETTAGLDYRDFEYTAKKAVDSFLSSPRSKKSSSEPWIMAISRITNDTTLNIDTDQLVKKIRIALQQSGVVRITTAISAGGAEDTLTEDVRNLDPEIFDLSTGPQKGTVLKPDLSLSGKIIQDINTIGDEQQIDYYFQLTITDLRTGLAYWDFEQIIVKLTEDDSFIW